MLGTLDTRVPAYPEVPRGSQSPWKLNKDLSEKPVPVQQSCLGLCGPCPRMGRARSARVCTLQGRVAGGPGHPGEGVSRNKSRWLSGVQHLWPWPRLTRPSGPGPWLRRPEGRDCLTLGPRVAT